LQALSEHRPWRERFFPNGEWVLAVALVFEICLFSAIGQNFFTRENFFEVMRLSVELGLLALALTPIMITGGIDLSVGSAMGMCAVVFGSLWRDSGVPVPLAALAALAVGTAGGLLNAFVITRLNVPPLIVTLGSFSLFRGIAEGLTRGAENYAGFPAGFLWLGQGYLGGVVPVQLPVLVVAVAAYWVLLHRSAVGRTIYVLGFSAGGARYAGIPVRRRVALLYLLSGIVAGLAAIIYVAHLGQAKSDAGTGYELAAITAVVLGGTSVFGGRGTVWGTVLGLFTISVLQNGLRLAALPSELTGVLTGVVLVLTIGLGRLRLSRHEGAAPVAEEEETMRNSQLAILCSTVIAGALIVAGTNAWLIRSVRPSGAPAPAVAEGRRLVIAMMPKAKGDPYFASCRKGAEDAANELGVELIWDGPTGLDAAKQNEVVEGWITRKVDAIAVAVENSPGLSTVLRKARDRGIPVVTWDSDSAPDSRDFFINQATPEGIGTTLADEGAKLTGKEGEYAIVTGPLNSANQNAWTAAIKKHMTEAYPKMKLVAFRPSDDDRDRAFAETQTILKVNPNVKLVITISAPAVPGTAEAVEQAGRKDVFVIGTSLPNLCKRYVHSGVAQAIVLWSTHDLGYLTLYTATRMAQGRFTKGATSLEGSKLGRIEVRGSEVLLGKPLVFTKANIDRYDF
jgi:rhamnose transport system substrate-binding protein